MNNHEIVRLLYHCKNIRSGDERLLEKITPEGMKIKLSTHDTATHCHIYLTIDGEPDLLVWYKTNWISSSYQFNEKGKVSGMQPKCGFAKPMLEKLFGDAAIRVADFETERDKRESAEQSAEQEKKNSLIARYQEHYQ